MIMFTDHNLNLRSYDTSLYANVDKPDKVNIYTKQLHGDI